MSIKVLSKKYKNNFSFLLGKRFAMRQRKKKTIVNRSPILPTSVKIILLSVFIGVGATTSN